MTTAVTKKKIVLPFYHTVAEQPLPHIKHLYRMKTVKEFQQDLDFLLKHFEPIDAEMLHHLHINQIITKNPVFHLTFDDGLKEIYEIVSPILLAKGVPATFFVNSGFVDNKALFYRFHASLAIEHLEKEKTLTDCIKNKILSCSYQDKEKLLPYFSQQQVDDFLNNEKPFLTTAQIQTLSKQGFTIGAHSIDHPYFYKIPFAEQLRQTRESVDFVSSIVKQKLRLFAFPFTDFNVSRNFFEEIEPSIDLSFGTAGLKNDEILFNLQRIGAEKNKFESLQSVLQKGYMKYIVRFFLRKNTIYRKASIESEPKITNSKIK